MPRCLVLPIFADKQLDCAVEGVREVLDAGEFGGAPNETALLSTGAQRTLLVGLGERDRFVTSDLARCAATAARYLQQRNIREITVVLPGAARDGEAASFVLEGALTGAWAMDAYKAPPHDARDIDVTIDADGSEIERGIARGRMLAESINLTRELAETPANDMTPTILAQRARAVADECGLAFNELDEAAMKELGMGALLGVAQGSAQEARLIVLRYDGDPGSDERLGLVGKGVTFDSGGISLKAAAGMEELKYDMCGGAAVIGTMRAVGKLQPNLNVTAVVPATENLPGPQATKPGDIHRALDGTTIEIVNTDAEGRLILADALSYAIGACGATRLIDCATLTGTVIDTLGHAAVGTVSNDDTFVDEFLRIANRSGERYWRLPLYDDYLEATRSEIADLKNFTGRTAATLVAAAFLREFVKGRPWIHLDLSGTAYLTEATPPHQRKGATGVPVRALVAFIEHTSAKGTQ